MNLLKLRLIAFTAVILFAAMYSLSIAKPPVSSTDKTKQAKRHRRGHCEGGCCDMGKLMMEFEAAEIVCIMDLPTPIYIVDIDNPNADPIILDRSFREYFQYFATFDSNYISSAKGTNNLSEESSEGLGSTVKVGKK